MKDLTFEQISAYFYLPIKEASKELKICATNLKKVCSANGIKRWPYRKFRSLENKIQKLKLQLQTTNPSEAEAQKIQNDIADFEEKKELLMRNPKISVDERVNDSCETKNEEVEEEEEKDDASLVEVNYLFENNLTLEQKTLSLYHVTNLEVNSKEFYDTLEATENTDKYFDIGVFGLKCVCFTVFPSSIKIPDISPYPLGHEVGEYKRVKVNINPAEYQFYKAGSKTANGNTQLHICAFKGETEVRKEWTEIKDIFTTIEGQEKKTFINIHVVGDVSLTDATWDKIKKIGVRSDTIRRSSLE